MFGLTKNEETILKKLSSPIKIQDFLDTIPMNFECDGDTHYSPRMALKKNTAHCIEGALIAAAALWYHGEQPLIMDMRGRRPDYDHILTLYKVNGYWGAISKTNHATIRFRDPVYKNIRELVLSYFHEWFMNTNGEKTFESYSDPLNLKQLGTEWVTDESHLWWIDTKLDALAHHPLVPKGNKKYIRKADPMELKAGRLTEWPK
ncbi:MAG: hypothetical protein AAB573_01770 [Patescibacteria group bacterium]